MDILYSDEHIAVAVKPYGALSESDDKKPNMPDMLKEALGCDHVAAVHRLDRTTQGLMVYALSHKAAQRLSSMAQTGEIEKTYLAVVEGAPEEDEGDMSDLLFYDRRKNKSYVVKRQRKGVKEARLRYRTLCTVRHEDMDISLIEVTLLTGRTHQIRVQFASRKMPLAGDRRYGSRTACDDIMLCSSRLRFDHPISGEKLSFEFKPDNGLFALFDTKL